MEPILCMLWELALAVNYDLGVIGFLGDMREV